jgi:plastocyanin
VLCSLILAPACNKKDNVGTEPEKPVTKIDPSTAAMIQGTIRLEGTIPPARPIDMTADPGCRGANSAETIIGKDGGLQNVFVYVKTGLGEHRFMVFLPTVTVDQDGCRYHPHVVGLMTGEKITFRNNDPTTHNIHASGQNNQQWNESQAPNAPLLQKTFSQPEIMLPIKCNQHPWMRMYVNVVSHPFFAVSGVQGEYKINGLPPGSYTLAFVHEKLGEQDVPITIEPNDKKIVDLTFKQP